MPTTTDSPAYVPPPQENAVSVEDLRASQQAVTACERPSIRHEIVTQGVNAVIEALASNALDVSDEGGQELRTEARGFVAHLAIEVLLRAALNPNFSVEDFRLTPFARADGGAHLLADFIPTGKRISFQVRADGTEASVALTGPNNAVPGDTIQSPDEAGQFIGWLTKKG